LTQTQVSVLNFKHILSLQTLDFLFVCWVRRWTVSRM